MHLLHTQSSYINPIIKSVRPAHNRLRTSSYGIDSIVIRDLVSDCILVFLDFCEIICFWNRSRSILSFLGSSNEGPLNISREHLVPGTPYTNFSVGLSSQQPGTPGLSQPGSLSKQHGTPSQQHGTPSQQTGTTSLQSRLSQPETFGNTRRILKPGMLSQPGSLSQQPGSLLQKPKTPFFGIERKQNAESPTPQGREPFTDPFSFDSEDSCSRDVIDGGGLFGRSVTLTPLQRPR